MKPATKTKLTSLLLLLTTNYLLLAQPLKAATSEGLSAIPPRLEEVKVKADGVITKTIKVRNESNQDKTITVSIEDFVVNDDKGTPTIVSSSKEDNRWAASSWLTVTPSNIKIKGGETKSLLLTITPPANALPGGHYAMIVYTPEISGTLNESTGASIQTKVGTLVYITIPGDIKQNAQVKNFSAPSFSEFGPISFKSTIQNLSDIHIKPAGNIAITNMFGLKTTNIKFNDPGDAGVNIFPGKNRDFTNELNKKWLFGRYKAELQAAYGTAGGVATAAIFFWVIPWRFLILLATAITIIVVIVMSLKKKSDGQKGTQEKVDELEKELEVLKKKYKDQ